MRHTPIRNSVICGGRGALVDPSVFGCGLKQLEVSNMAETPKGLRKPGEALWTAINSAVALDRRDEVLLLEASRVADRLAGLDRLIRRGGLALPDGRPNPLLAEARQQQITLARLITALQLPADLTEPERRPQRRGVRGVYNPRISLVEREAL